MTYSWVMGPTNFATMDTRPSEGAHDLDWAEVHKFVVSIEPPTYWTFEPDLSHTVAIGTENKDVLWVYDIKSGQTHRFMELVSKMKQVYATKIPNESFRIVWNNFADTKLGYDVAVIFGASKWAMLDNDRDFSKLFEEVHGPNSWHNFLNDLNATTNGRVDWMGEHIE